MSNDNTPTVAAVPAEPVGHVRVDSGELHFVPKTRDAESSGFRDGQPLYAAPQATPPAQSAPPAAPAPAPESANQELLVALRLIAGAERSWLGLAYCKDVARAAINRAESGIWGDCYQEVIAKLDAMEARAESGAPAPAPQPLTDEQIDAIATPILAPYVAERDRMIARAIEAAHGITGGATGGSSGAPAPAPQPQPLTDAERDVMAERRRQVEVEGWTPEHDDDHKGGGMAFAAAAYAVIAAGHAKTSFFVVSLWKWTGWAESWLKPKTPREDLVRAGALIVAEIERMDRASGITGGATGEAA